MFTGVYSSTGVGDTGGTEVDTVMDMEVMEVDMDMEAGQKIFLKVQMRFRYQKACKVRSRLRYQTT